MKEKILKLRREGKSYNDISKILGCAKSTISYHCSNENLGHVNKKTLSENDIVKIKELYRNNIRKIELSKMFNVSEYEIKKHVKNIKRNSKFPEGLTKKQKQVILVSDRRRKLKQMSVEYKGGKCEKCGYDKCIAVLEFHHIDPSKKDFAISSNGHTRSWDKIKEELDKCIMVCANCHREIHYNLNTSMV